MLFLDELASNRFDNMTSGEEIPPLPAADWASSSLASGGIFFGDAMAQDDAHKMVKELLDDESDRLTPWEQDFLDSVHKQQYLSAKQIAIIEKIWEKIYG